MANNIPTSQKILAHIEERNQVTAIELLRLFGISRQALQKQLKNLLEAGELIKVGRPPKVFYSIAKKKTGGEAVLLNPELVKIIDQNFLNITATGEREEGVVGFAHWCEKRGLPVEKTAGEYQETIKKYAQYKNKKNDLIDGMYKLRHTFEHVYLDKLLYLDFYSIERFGKTKLGQILLYAKQSQDRNLIAELIREVRPKILDCVRQYKISAVGFIPPTVKREVQLMREMESQLALSLPTINLTKIKTPITVPQKTLTKLEDRIENAKDTIIVEGEGKYNRLLLIDDALGSGATLNETAKKLKERRIVEEIIGLAITGSFSGFEVISEV